MSKSGKQIVAEAAKRAADAIIPAANRSIRDDHIQLPDFKTTGMIRHEFAPFAELIEAARHSHEMNQVTPALCAALAAVEKMGGR